jgi:hypothetical protein
LRLYPIVLEFLILIDATVVQNSVAAATAAASSLRENVRSNQLLERGLNTRCMGHKHEQAFPVPILFLFAVYSEPVAPAPSYLGKCFRGFGWSE